MHSVCNSWRHQTYYGAPLGPEERREGIGGSQKAWIGFR